MIYVSIAGLVMGFVATYFTFRFLPYRPITEPLVLENVLDALGFSLYRILVPVLTTILVAARCGAAVTSDVGGKVHGQQIDALRTLGIKPARYLLTPILYAFLVGGAGAGPPVVLARAFRKSVRLHHDASSIRSALLELPLSPQLVRARPLAVSRNRLAAGKNSVLRKRHGLALLSHRHETQTLDPRRERRNHPEYFTLDNLCVDRASGIALVEFD